MNGISTLIIFLDFIYLFSERGEGKEKEEVERNIAHPQLGAWSATHVCALTGNRTSDLSVCRLALNPLGHTSQDGISAPKKHSREFSQPLSHVRTQGEGGSLLPGSQMQQTLSLPGP